MELKELLKILIQKELKNDKDFLTNLTEEISPKQKQENFSLDDFKKLLGQKQEPKQENFSLDDFKKLLEQKQEPKQENFNLDDFKKLFDNGNKTQLSMESFFGDLKSGKINLGGKQIDATDSKIDEALGLNTKTIIRKNN